MGSPVMLNGNIFYIVFTGVRCLRNRLYDSVAGVSNKFVVPFWTKTRIPLVYGILFHLGNRMNVFISLLVLNM